MRQLSSLITGLDFQVASLVAQMVKNLPAMQETQVQSLGQEDPVKGIATHSSILWASQVALVVKNPPANAGDIRDKGSIPGSGRSPGRGHGNPLQYSCLEYPMDRGAWSEGYSSWGHKESDIANLIKESD